MYDWEVDYAEFVAVHIRRLHRLAHDRCGDWEVAAALTRRVLLRLYRTWNSPGHEPPEAFVERSMLNLLRRKHVAATAADGVEPAMGFTADDLIRAGRSQRRRLRAATAVLTALGLVAGGTLLYLLRPAPGGGFPIDGIDCMEGIPPAVTALPASAIPSGTLLDTGATSGPGRFTALTGDLPLPGPGIAFEQARADTLTCRVAEMFRTMVGPIGLDRVYLALNDSGDRRPLAALPDPALAPAALTVSVRIITASGLGTVTISVAPTTFEPAPDHCERLAFCQLSNTTSDGRIVEQYGLRNTPEALAAGYRIGTDAQWWSVAVYSGHTLVLVTVTNTPDIGAALPSTMLYTPLGPQVTVFAADHRLSLFDPPLTASPTTS